jgi:hypothetical protein
MRRAVAYLAAEAGMRQFLDIGTGIPTSPNLHEVAQDIAPAARVVYADNDPYGIVARLMDAVPSGSHLVITHPASDVNGEAVAEGARRYNQSVATRQTRRSFTEVTRFFEGLDVVEPGMVQCHRWRPGPGVDVREYEVSAWTAVARKRCSIAAAPTAPMFHRCRYDRGQEDRGRPA